MDYFNNKTNQDFEKYLTDTLETKMHFIHYTDPNDFLYPDDAYDFHITESLQKLYNYIKSEITASGITEDEEILKIFNKKREELNIDPIIEDYIERIIVDYK